MTRAAQANTPASRCLAPTSAMYPSSSSRARRETHQRGPRCTCEVRASAYIYPNYFSITLRPAGVSQSTPDDTPPTIFTKPHLTGGHFTKHGTKIGGRGPRIGAASYRSQNIYPSHIEKALNDARASGNTSCVQSFPLPEGDCVKRSE